MVNVKKSDFWRRTHASDEEPFEEFNRKKIEMALVRSGARGAIVEEIAALVEPFEGITTKDIDMIVVEELNKRDPEAARYWSMMHDYKSGRFR